MRPTHGESTLHLAVHIKDINYTLFFKCKGIAVSYLAYFSESVWLDLARFYIRLYL